MFDDDLQPETGERNAPASALNLRQLWWFLTERWWLMVLCIGVAGLVAGIYAYRAIRIYAATAVIKFESDPASLVPGMAGDQVRGEDARQEKLKEFQQIIQSRALLTQVIARNNLDTHPNFAPNGLSLPPERLAGRLLSAMRVTLRAGTRLIDVSVQNADPVLAAQLANSVVAELIRQDAESHKSSSQNAATFLGEEAQRLQQKLTECDAKLQEYKDQSLSLEQRQTVVGDSLKDLNRQLSEAKIERIRLESEYLGVRELDGNIAKLLTVPRIAGDSTVIALQSSLAQQEVEFANVRQVYLKKHPTYLQAEGKLGELRQALSNATIKVGETLRQACDNARAREATLTKELAQQEQSVRNLNTQSVPYNTLLRDREQLRALYDAVVKRMGETTMSGNLVVSRIQIFQAAETPRNPIKPNRLMILAGGLMVGALIGLAINIGWMLADDSLKTLAEAEQFLQLPVLSTIPRIKGGRPEQTHFVVNNEAPSAGAQSFRYLRTSLAIGDPDNKCQSYLLTSTMPGEGKTFCSLNFAASLARQGLRTLLVDCDLQRPTLSKQVLGAAHPIAGVTDFLAGRSSDIRATEIENLSFCSAGTPIPNASEMLAQRRLTDFLTTAFQQYDRVVVDSAPLFGVSDTLLIVHDVQAVCLVVRAGSTSRAAVARSIQILRKAGATITGVILNAVPESRMSIHGNPYYDYGYKSKA